MQGLVLCEQHIRLFDTSVGTFLGPPFEVLGSRANKRWSEEVPTVVSKSIVCCSHNTSVSAFRVKSLEVLLIVAKLGRV